MKKLFNLVKIRINLLSLLIIIIYSTTLSQSIFLQLPKSPLDSLSNISPPTFSTTYESTPSKISSY